MRPRLPIVFACLALAAALGAEAQTKARVLSSSVVPARPYVGDLVESTLVFDSGAFRPKEGDLSIPTPSSGQDVEILWAGIKRRADGWVYSVRFRAWVSGDLHVPVVESVGLSLPEVPLQIASALEDFGRSPPRFKDPLEIPGTRLLVWGVSGAALMTLLLAWSVLFGLLPWVRRLRKAWREGRAARDFDRALDYLEDSYTTLKIEELWAILVKDLRAYLSARTNLPYRSYTAREAGLVAPDDLPEGVARETADLLAESDEVRFARRPRAQDARGAIARSRRIMELLEEAARDGVR